MPFPAYWPWQKCNATLRNALYITEEERERGGEESSQVDTRRANTLAPLDASTSESCSLCSIRIRCLGTKPGLEGEREEGGEREEEKERRGRGRGGGGERGSDERWT